MILDLCKVVGTCIDNLNLQPVFNPFAGCAKNTRPVYVALQINGR